MSSIALLLILLPVFATLVLSIPNVQNRAVRYATAFASEKLGTKVGIDHITIGMFNHVKVRGFYVEDMDCDTLLYASTVVAQIGPLATIREAFIITSARVERVRLYLRDTERGTINIKEVTDKLINRDREKKGNFHLKINKVQVDSVDFRITQRGQRESNGGWNYDDIYIRDIDAQVDDFYVQTSPGRAIVGGDIASLCFMEQSGFVLDDLTGTFCVDSGKISLDNVTLTSGNSQVNIPSLLLSGENWLSYRDFINNVRLDVEIENTSVSSDMIGYFAPQLWGWNTELRDIKASMHGTVANFKARVDNLRLEDGGSIRAMATVKGLVDVYRTRFNVNVTKVDVTTKEFTRLLNNIAHLEIPEGVKPYIERTNRLKIGGKFKGYITSFDAEANVDVGSGGHLHALCGIHPEDEQRVVSATLTADSLNVNKLLAKPQTIAADFTVKAEARLGEQVSADASGEISSLLLNGYEYSNLNFDGAYSPTASSFNFASNDPSLKAQLRAAMNNDANAEPYYSAVAQIDHADLHAMNINRRDSISTLKASLWFDAVGSTLDDIDGRLSIGDAEYNYNNEQVSSDLMELTVVSNEDTRRVNLSSEFIDAVFESRCPYKDVAYYISTLISRYLPQLYDSKTLQTIEKKKQLLKNKVALLSVTAKDISPLLDCFVTGVEVAPQSTLNVYMAPGVNRFIVRGSSECIERYPYLASGVTIAANNRGDSLVMDIGSSELWASSVRLSDFSLHGGAKRNVLNLYGEFADTVRDVRGEVAARALLSRRNDMRHIAVEVLPSHIGKDNNIWKITSGGIDIDSTRIAVDQFRVYNAVEGQDLIVDGVASRQSADSLQLVLKNFELTPFVQFATQIGYQIEGRTSGYVTVHSALKDASINAAVDLDSIYINTLPIDNLKLSSRWDFGRSRAKLSVMTAKSGKEIASGYLFPSQSRYFARILFDKLDMALLDPLLSGVLKNTSGSARVDLMLTGQKRNASLNGEILVTDMSTMLDYTKCTYTAPKAVVKVQNNKFSLKDAPIYDKSRNSGLLSLDLNLNHLSNIEYAVGARINNMQVMNTTKRDNEMFYGSMFASGDVSVRGDKAGVKIDIDAVSGDKSKFYMPLSNKSDISSADFVTFVKPMAADTTDYLVRKKMMFERRQKRRTDSDSNMDINLSLDVRENTEVQIVIDPTVGDIIKGTGNGMLNLRIDTDADIFEMYGIYTISEGSYLFTLQNIINKKFVIDRGSTIQWTGEPLDALLDIDAVYKVKASLQPLLEGYVDTSIPTRAVPVNCIIKLLNRHLQPQRQAFHNPQQAPTQQWQQWSFLH